MSKYCIPSIFSPLFSFLFSLFKILPGGGEIAPQNGGWGVCAPFAPPPPPLEYDPSCSEVTDRQKTHRQEKQTHSDRLKTLIDWRHWQTKDTDRHTDRLKTLTDWRHWQTEDTDRLKTLTDWRHWQTKDTDRLKTLTDWRQKTLTD